MNRFKEMVDAGVASFHYYKNAEETPDLDPFVRTYNIYWGTPTNTHMDFVDGRYIITGSLFERESQYFDNGFLWNRWVKGMDVKSSGYGSLSDFLYRNNKDYKKIDLNGSVALEVFERPENNADCYGYDCPVGQCICATMTCDSKIPESVSSLELKKGVIKEIKEKCDTMKEFADKLNESKLCKGTFDIMGGDLICMVGNKTYTIIK